MIELFGIAVLIIFGGGFLLFVIFEKVMAYKHKREREGRLSWKEKVVAYPLLGIGYPGDVVYNIFVATVVFWDWPQNATLSSRIDRYWKNPPWPEGHWRMRLTRWLGKKLNEIDPGHVG